MFVYSNLFMAIRRNTDESLAATWALLSGSGDMARCSLAWDWAVVKQRLSGRPNSNRKSWRILDVMCKMSIPHDYTIHIIILYIVYVLYYIIYIYLYVYYIYVYVCIIYILLTPDCNIVITSMSHDAMSNQPWPTMTSHENSDISMWRYIWNFIYLCMYVYIYMQCIYIYI